MRGQPSSGSIQSRRANSGILQVHRLEQLVKSDVRVHAIQSCGSRRHQPQHSRERTIAEAGETQIEPGHIRLHLADGTQQTGYVAMLSEAPTANHRKPRKFFGGCREIISQHRQINTPFLPKLVRHVETILIQRMATRRK